MNRHQPIFAYGILRKRSFIQMLRRNYDVEEIKLIPATIKGWIPYNSKGINVLVPVTEKARTKKPKAEFVVKGTLLSIIAHEDTLDAIYSFIDSLEKGYYKASVVTEMGTSAWLYYVESDFFTYINTYGRGLVIYPDSILHDVTYIGKEHTALTEYNSRGLSPYERYWGD